MTRHVAGLRSRIGFGSLGNGPKDSTARTALGAPCLPENEPSPWGVAARDRVRYPIST